jgi:uncharacterized protein YndB with AHSA1/START domain
MKTTHNILAAATALVFGSAHVAQAEARSSGAITIKAPIERVWGLVVGIDAWPQWNKAVQSARMEGPVARGGRFDWKSRGFGIHSTFETVIPFTRVSWRGETLGTHAVHRWEFRATPDGIVVTTVETMTGLVPTLMPGGVQQMLDEVIPNLLSSLKTAAERPELGQ